MKKYYLTDTFWLLVLSYLYLWPFFDKGDSGCARIFLSVFLSGVFSYLVFQLVLRFKRLPAFYGALVFVFSGLELTPMFYPNQRLYFGIFPTLLALLAFLGKKRKIFILASITALFAVVYILAKISLIKIMVNFCFVILSMIGLDYFVNDKENLFRKRYENIRNFFRDTVMLIILTMLGLYTFLIFWGEAIIVINIVYGFAWFTLFSVLALAIIYLKDISYEFDLMLYIFILTIIDIFTFWQGRFNL